MRYINHSGEQSTVHAGRRLTLWGRGTKNIFTLLENMWVSLWTQKHWWRSVTVRIFGDDSWHWELMFSSWRPVSSGPRVQRTKPCHGFDCGHFQRKWVKIHEKKRNEKATTGKKKGLKQVEEWEKTTTFPPFPLTLLSITHSLVPLIFLLLFSHSASPAAFHLTRMTQHGDEPCDLGVCSGWTVREFLGRVSAAFPSGRLATPIGGHGDVLIGSLKWIWKYYIFQSVLFSRETVEHSFCSTFRFSNSIHLLTGRGRKRAIILISCGIFWGLCSFVMRKQKMLKVLRLLQLRTTGVRLRRPSLTGSWLAEHAAYGRQEVSSRVTLEALAELLTSASRAC